MRRRPALFAILWALLQPAPMLAAPLSVDLVLAIHSSLAPPVYFQGSGSASGSVDGSHLRTLTLPAGVLATQAAATLAGIPIRVDAANGQGLFEEAADGSWAGVMPLLGSLELCPTLPCLEPLGLQVVGAGGSSTAAGGSLRLTGFPWQTTPITLQGPGFVSVFSGYQLGPASMPSSTALSGGFLLFITPAQVTLPGVGAIDTVVELGITVRAPEPAALPVLALALLSALWAASLRTRRPSDALPGSGAGNTVPSERTIS